MADALCRPAHDHLHTYDAYVLDVDGGRPRPLGLNANVVLTPHTAWSSARVLDRSIDLFCDNLVRFSRGEPLRNVVDPTAGY